MIVVVLTLAPESTKGVVSRYLMEISSGVFVGEVNAKIRDELWNFVLGNLGKGSVVMAYTDNSVRGHQIRTHNLNKRIMKEIDGVELIFIESADAPEKNSSRTGWSKQSRYLRR